MSNLSMGMSCSYIVSKNFDWRIADLYLSFIGVNLTNEIRTASTRVTDEYESTGSNLGFTFDTGLVFYPAPPYIAIELLGGYSFFTIEDVQGVESFNELITTSDFIDSGGFFASAVLTVGIPFD